MTINTPLKIKGATKILATLANLGLAPRSEAIIVPADHSSVTAATRTDRLALEKSIVNKNGLVVYQTDTDEYFLLINDNAISAGSSWIKLGFRQKDLANFRISIATQGSTAGASTINIQALDVNGNPFTTAVHLRVRLCNNGTFANSTNGTIAVGANTTLLEAITTSKDLNVKTHTNGLAVITLTDASAETVTLRIGNATFGGIAADYTPTQQVTHAAP